MITSLAFIVYPVSDIAAARRFYEEILGLRMTHEFSEEWFEYDLGDTTFAITSTDTDHPALGFRRTPLARRACARRSAT